MLRAALPILLILLPAASGAAMAVSPDAVSASDGTVLVRWGEQAAGTLRLEGGSIGGILSDTVKTDRLALGGTPLTPLGEGLGTRRNETASLPDGAGRVSLLGASGATVLVQPLAANYRAFLSSAGPVTLEAVDHEVLESNHAYKDAEPEEDAHDNYVFRVHDAVAAHASDPTQLLVQGDFLLYVWNATLLQQLQEGTWTHPTGTWREPGSAPGLEDIHHQHALVLVHDGYLRISAPAGASLYAPRLHLHDPGGEGSADAASVLYLPTTAMATPDGDRVVLTPTVRANPPQTATPDVVPPALAWAPWVAGLALLGAALAPNVIGWRRPGDPDQSTTGMDRFRRARASGYRHLAVQAEGQRRYRHAAFWMGRAARWDGEAETLMQHAIYLRLAGRPGRALKHHRVAEEAFRTAGAAHALNAYEAARAAARLGRVEESLQWLLAAVREERWLGQRAPVEPDLAPLRTLPAFMDLVQASDPDGFLRP